MHFDEGYEGQPHGSNLGQDLRILDGIASWCGALHGSMPLDGALKALAEALGAEVSMIARDARSDGTCREVALFDGRGNDRNADHMRRAFAPDVLGEFYNRMRAGSFWFLSDHEDDPGFEYSRGLSGWRLSRGISDIVVVALESTGLQHDYVEFHFVDELSREDRERLTSMLPTLVRAWSGRKRGLVTQVQMDERIQRARANAEAQKIKPEEAILGVSNPANLSRAEFRVCLLLSRGLSVKGVTDELGLSEATVRSHLRSIYAKTDTSGLPELVYRLLSGGQERGGLGIVTGGA